MNKKTLLLSFILIFQMVILHTNSDTNTSSPLFSIEQTIFVNGRVNNILLVLTDNKNNQYQIPIKMGSQYLCNHKSQDIKKVICYEKMTPSTTLTQADLKTYSVFVFNTDQKIEKYNFIDIHQKNLALKKAREGKKETLYQEIAEQNVYKL